jgi:ribosomal protein L12E/L44/L45/RPP1/RPP2
LLEQGSKKLAVGFAAGATIAGGAAEQTAPADNAATETQEEDKKEDKTDDSDSVCRVESAFS